MIPKSTSTNPSSPFLFKIIFNSNNWFVPVLILPWLKKAHQRHFFCPEKYWNGTFISWIKCQYYVTWGLPAFPVIADLESLRLLPFVVSVVIVSTSIEKEKWQWIRKLWFISVSTNAAPGGVGQSELTNRTDPKVLEWTFGKYSHILFGSICWVETGKKPSMLIQGSICMSLNRFNRIIRVK